MSLHDAYARVTPLEIAFGEPARAERLARDVVEEANARGAEPEIPEAFLTLGSVGAFVHEIEPDADPGSVHRYGTLAFHGVHSARAGFPLYLLSVQACRYLVEGAPSGEPVPLDPAGYVQLPRHLFWMEDGADQPESVDGLFWTVTGAGILRVLLVGGVRHDRSGLLSVPLPEAPLADAPRWLTVDASDGGDFTTSLPGGEIDGLYGLRTAGEVLKLLARFFAYAASVPAALQRQGSGEATGGDPAPKTGSADETRERGGAQDPAPAPSALTYTRVTLEA